MIKTFLKWFDNEIEPECEESISDKADKKIDWIRCLPFFFLHLGCFGIFFVGWSWAAIIIALLLYLVRMFAITAFYHRYFSHRSFKTSRGFQFIFALLGNTAVQRGPLWWAANHRFHHANSDSKSDIHSPRQDGFWWSHMFWFTNRNNFKLKSELVSDFKKYPELRFIDRFDIIIPLMLAILLLFFGNLLELFMPELKTNGPQILVWGFFVSTVILFHATCSTNSFAHLYGYQRYLTKDDSKNNVFIAILTLGEGWHNNHHYNPNSAKHGVTWWELDITYYLLLFFSYFGFIWDLRKFNHLKN